ncbi:MAG TPA: SO2930 family diheme c-type cytochrome [Pirellulales bacterium]|nr:SO2930 family diheme c-type cytochrome [Pirellulales bacterium]
MATRRRRFAFLPILLAVMWLSAMPARAAETRRTTIEPGPEAQKRLQTALIEAEPGDVVELAAGRYEFNSTISLAVDGVTLRGAGADKTIISFEKLLPGTGGEGLLVTGNAFVLENLAIEDARGDAVKVTGADGVTLRGLRVEWTGGPKTTNGSYGLYPVLCKNVLVEHCTVRGSSDAGIYVGQSTNIIVRHNLASQNVAGIEIENSISADVHDNDLKDNAAGLLIFALPDLVQKECRRCRAFNNRIVANNHENFAPTGNIVAQVPSGTGLMVMAGDQIEIFDNHLKDNQTANLAVISYLATRLDFSDAGYDPYSEAIWVHDNRFEGGGDKPAGDLALLKVVLFRRTLPDMILDWSENAALHADGALPAELRTVFSDNGDADFARIDLAAKIPSPNKVSQDLVTYVGKHAPLPAVDIEPSTSPIHRVLRRPVPQRLSELGLFRGNGAAQQPVEGVFPYDVNTPLFSDYTAKHRFVKLPRGEPAKYSPDGPFEFPVGTRLIKTFAMPHDLRRPEDGQRLLETRVLENTAQGWTGVSYIWNDEQTEAFLAPAGDTIDVEWVHADGERRRNNYLVPNVNQCQGCHATTAGMAPIGIQARHLNREFDYGDVRENQLTHWSKVGSLAGAPRPDVAPRAVAWDDPAAGLDERARAWLEINCAHCHQPGGNAQNSGLDLRLSQLDPRKLGVLKPPVAAGTGSGGMQYDIVPGKPDKSIMMVRLQSTHPDVMMPELGKRLVPEEAVELVRQWIAAMK